MPATPTTTKVKTTAGSAQLDLTFRIAVVGIVAVLIALIAALIAFHGSKNPGQVIPAVVGAVTAAIGTLAGLVAGHAAGAAGKADSDQRASANEQDAAAGRALAKSMLIDQPSSAQSQDPQDAQLVAAPHAQPDATDLARRHAELARSLFPNLDA